MPAGSQKKGSRTSRFRPVLRRPLFILQIYDDDGEGYESVRLRENEIVIGRREGDIRIPHDSVMSSEHARLYYESGELNLEDLGSANGTFVRLDGPKCLADGDEILLGSHRFRFVLNEQPATAPEEKSSDPNTTMVWGAGGKTKRLASELVEIDCARGDGRRHPLIAPVETLGSARPESTLVFPDDEFMYSAHATITRTEQGLVLEDQDSLNGVWIRLRSQMPLVDGSKFMLGEQVFGVKT